MHQKSKSRKQREEKTAKANFIPWQYSYNGNPWDVFRDISDYETVMNLYRGYFLVPLFRLVDHVALLSRGVVTKAKELLGDEFLVERMKSGKLISLSETEVVGPYHPEVFHNSEYQNGSFEKICAQNDVFYSKVRKAFDPNAHDCTIFREVFEEAVTSPIVQMRIAKALLMKDDWRAWKAGRLDMISNQGWIGIRRLDNARKEWKKTLDKHKRGLPLTKKQEQSIKRHAEGSKKGRKKGRKNWKKTLEKNNSGQQLTENEKQAIERHAEGSKKGRKKGRKNWKKTLEKNNSGQQLTENEKQAIERHAEGSKKGRKKGRKNWKKTLEKNKSGQPLTENEKQSIKRSADGSKKANDNRRKKVASAAGKELDSYWVCMSCIDRKEVIPRVILGAQDGHHSSQVYDKRLQGTYAKITF